MKHFAQFLSEGAEVKPQLGLNDIEVRNTVDDLKALLANLHVVHIKIHNFHWNVRGPFFGPLHKLFDDVYDRTGERLDKVAERIRAIGGVPPGSMSEFLALTTLSEAPGELLPCEDMLKKLVTDFEHLSAGARIALQHIKDDEGTMNLLADFVEHVDKDAWFLRSHLAS